MADDFSDVLTLEPGGYEPFEREAVGQDAGLDADASDDFDPFLNNL